MKEFQNLLLILQRGNTKEILGSMATKLRLLMIDIMQHVRVCAVKGLLMVDLLFQKN